ncbi:EAL domain-containing response regulator [Photobacterium japonica]|uniref:EAL domain-containing response regulator n=1 Tax=Photobacterium japonica TaxID=2910235 RepID=UPI003D0CDC75
MKILLIEDHPFQQHVLTNQIKQASNGQCQVICAASGKEALTLMASHSLDLLICDLNMPEMDGIAFLSHLAQQHYQGGIIISSAATPAVLHSVGKMCANYQLDLLGTLSKPTTLDNLRLLLTKAEQLQHLRHATPRQVHPTHQLSEDDILQALSEGWLIPHYQPIVDIQSGQWDSCEALIRMQHPTLGLLTPMHFLPLLTAMGKDAELAMLTLRYTLSHLTALQGRRVAINITPQTLIAKGFVDNVIALLQQHPNMNQIISFEITESDALENADQGLEAASRLGIYGFRLSIDDFGTGYSSLKQLDLLPFESLKIDMSFIQALPDNRTAQAIVEASLLLANRLSLDTIAEGIEEDQQWQLLQQMQCQKAQGFFIGKPMPIQHLVNWHLTWQAQQAVTVSPLSL